MNWPILFLMIFSLIFIISVFSYNRVRFEKFIKADWIDLSLLSIFYAFSFALFSLTVTNSLIKNILPLTIFIVTLQILWSLFICNFMRPSISILFSTFSFLICAISTQLLERDLMIGIVPFLFINLVQIQMSINISENNFDFA